MINIILCDDCSKTQEIITNIVNQTFNELKIKNFNIITFNNSSSSISYIKNNPNEKNIYILDIDLNEERNGLLLGREIRKLDNYSGEIIFVTNHSQMAFKSFQFKLKALEFIDKNYNMDKHLKESLIIATNLLLNKNNNIQEDKKLKIKIGCNLYNVLLKDIICIETIKNSRKVVLYTSNNRLQFYDTLKNLNKLLSDDFIQIYKTTIINKNYIEYISRDFNSPYVLLKNGAQCPVSRDILKEVINYWG